jgi:hypothetical protein
MTFCSHVDSKVLCTKTWAFPLSLAGASPTLFANGPVLHTQLARSHSGKRGSKWSRITGCLDRASAAVLASAACNWHRVRKSEIEWHTVWTIFIFDLYARPTSKSSKRRSPLRMNHILGSCGILWNKLRLRCWCNLAPDLTGRQPIEHVGTSGAVRGPASFHWPQSQPQLTQ